VEQVIALVVKDMSELAALQHLSTHSFNTISAPPIRSINSPKHLDKSMLPRTPARTPSLFEMQTMGYGFRGAHVDGRHGAAPRVDFPKGVKNDAPDHRDDVPPRHSPRIQKQDLHVDDEAQASYYYHAFSFKRMLTRTYMID
jgi:hypothetical protein